MKVSYQTKTRRIEKLSMQSITAKTAKESPILAICPTRQRPEKCARMLESFEETKANKIDLIFCIDTDDPCLSQYLDLFGNEHAFYLLERMTITEIFNKVALELEPSYEVYHTANDDFIYRTQNFDQLIMDSIDTHGSGVHYGNDGHWGADMAVAPFITADMVKAVGWLQMPKLKHLCNDTIWTFLGFRGRFLYYIPEILIDHIHPETRNIPKDEVTKRVNSPYVYEWDYKQFAMWKMTRMEIDLGKCLATQEKTVSKEKRWN